MTDLPTALEGDFERDSAVRPVAGAAGRYEGHIPEAWNVHYVFGGMSMACALRAAQQAVGRDDLGLLTANALFVRPVSAGPLEIEATVLRNGRTAAQAIADLRNPHHDGVALHLTATFGEVGDSSIDYLDAQFPDVPMPDECEPPSPLDDSPFNDINFHHQIDYRPIAPWTATTWEPGPAVFSSWQRFVTEPRLADGTIDPIALAIPSDIMGSAVARRVGPRQAFFVLSLEIGLQVFRPTRSTWLLQHVVAPVVSDGYASGSVELWDTDGRLVALSTQRARLRLLEPGAGLGPRS